MSPTSPTPELRDRRFSRVRRLTQTILVGSGVVSGVMVGFVAANTKPVTTIPHSVPAVTPTTAPHATTTTPSAAQGTTTTPAYTPPVTAPVAAAPVCTTTPSGTVVCH